jgi:glc operon protein GlcG
VSLPNKTVLDLSTARALTAACEAKARENGWRMTIAIADLGGELLQYTRMDGAMPISFVLSRAKALTSSRLPLSTRKVREPAGKVGGLERTEGVTTVAGGVPIMSKAGEWIGAIGISGDSEDNDEICAQAGLDAVKHLL